MYKLDNYCNTFKQSKALYRDNIDTVDAPTPQVLVGLPYNAIKARLNTKEVTGVRYYTKHRFYNKVCTSSEQLLSFVYTGVGRFFFMFNRGKVTTMAFIPIKYLDQPMITSKLSALFDTLKYYPRMISVYVKMINLVLTCDSVQINTCEVA